MIRPAFLLALPAVLSISALLACASCSTVSTVGSWFPSSEGWAFKTIPAEKKVYIAGVNADVLSAWDSLERETSELLPLLLLDHGYLAAETPKEARFILEAVIIEREYMAGWKNRSSLSAEIRFRPAGEDPGPTPLAAGRAMLDGEAALRSSRVLNRLLKKALGEAVKALETGKGR